MKILTLISGGDVGGAKTHVLTLLKELNEVITADLVCFREGDFADEAREMQIPTTVVNSGRVDKDLKELKTRISEGDYDIVHCHGSRANFLGSLLKSGLKIPVITTVHSDPKLDYMGRPAGKLVYGSINQRALRRLDYYIGVSDAMTELLIDRGFPADKIFTIYNGINFESKESDFDRDAYLSWLGIDPFECVVAGIAARLNPVKDIATLIKGFAEAERECPNLRLLIAGDGEQREMLESLAKELGVVEKIRFLGWVSNIGDFYKALDINTLTSLSETFPYALTEGAREWLPTVSSRVGGVPYLIDDGINGFMFPAGDYKKLGECLKELAKDPELRRNMGQRLGQKARECYSLEATRNTQLNIYETAIRRYRRAQERVRDGVAICGAYGRGNTGDNAILEAIIKEMRGIDPDMPLYVLSKDPSETRKLYRVNSIFTFNIPAFRNAVRKTKLYINGGGSLIQDVTSRRSLIFYLYNIMAAKRLGNRVLMYGCGIGPVLRPLDRWLSGKVLNKYVDIITLREDSSAEELKRLGVSKPQTILSADPALSLAPAPEEVVDSVFRSQGVPVKGKYICFGLRNWNGFSEKLPSIAAAAEYAYRKFGLTPVFVPIDLHDIDVAEKVASRLSVPYHIMKSAMSACQVIGVMSRMTVVVSMRLHGLIFTTRSGAPLIGIAYDPKVSAFMKYLGQDLCCGLNEVSEELLTEMIDKAMIKSADKDSLIAHAKRVVDAERINTDVARRILSE